jgi:hypothetical protein
MSLRTTRFAAIAGLGIIAASASAQTQQPNTSTPGSPARAAEHIAATSTATRGNSVLHKPGALSKADTGLARALENYKARAGSRPPGATKPTGVPAVDDYIPVDARARGDGAELMQRLLALGLQGGSHYGNVVSGRLPLSAIETALELPELRSMTASQPPIRNAGFIDSQGDAALRADIARSSYLVDGSGVTVGVISDSFDTLGGAAADIASGDLPAAGVTVLNGESTYCGTLIFCIDEARAMLQIIHDLAPGAGLAFASGIEGIAAYANAITGLAAAGAKVIVDDLLIVQEPMFQDGVIAQAIDSVVTSGTAYYSAAGNSGRNGFETGFVDSGEVLCIEFFEPEGDCDPMFERVGNMHDFDPGPGIDNYLGITVPLNGVVTIAMQWDQPFGGPGPETDHDLVLLDATGQTYVTISANDNVAMGEGWEALRYENSEFLGQETEFGIAITYDDIDSIGPPANLLRLVIFGSDVTINEYPTNSGTLYGHANSAGTVAVGAAFYLETPEFGISPPLLEPFSSAGGVPILFDTAGVPLSGPEVRQKPEITAVDGVNTTFFFDDSFGDDGIDDFFGTSAAAPHAAAIAALMLEARPDATPGQLRNALQDSAIDMGPAGFDFDSGYGLVRADIAIAEVLAAGPVDSDGDGVPDSEDAFPNNPTEWSDTDGDGVGDNADAFPTDPLEWNDQDDDGIGDNADAFPADPTEWSDIDGDGVGDNGDAFPADPTEAIDTDLDGIGNNSDTDDDNDGVSDDADNCPLVADPSHLDTDADGQGDACDADDDNDGVFDLADAYPLGQFADVSPMHWAFQFIEAAARNGVTGGCGGGNYCPDDLVTRAQMAVFLERGMRGSDYVPPPASGNVFLDVAATDFGANFIEQLFADGVTGGCGGGNYCPNSNVTRAQMAVFLLRAKYGALYDPPPATGVFLDVPMGSFADKWIEQLALEGITGGCGGGNYCPNEPVARDQMAVFLVRAFSLPIVAKPDLGPGQLGRGGVAVVFARQSPVY